MADAHGSGPCVRKDVEVQLLSRAQRKGPRLRDSRPGAFRFTRGCPRRRSRPSRPSSPPNPRSQPEFGRHSADFAASTRWAGPDASAGGRCVREDHVGLAGLGSLGCLAGGLGDGTGVAEALQVADDGVGAGLGESFGEQAVAAGVDDAGDLELGDAAGLGGGIDLPQGRLRALGELGGVAGEVDGLLRGLRLSGRAGVAGVLPQQERGSAVRPRADPPDPAGSRGGVEGGPAGLDRPLREGRDGDQIGPGMGRVVDDAVGQRARFADQQAGGGAVTGPAERSRRLVALDGHSRAGRGVGGADQASSAGVR